MTYSGYTCTSCTLNPELQVVEPARWKVVKFMVLFFGYHHDFMVKGSRSKVYKPNRGPET